MINLNKARQGIKSKETHILVGILIYLAILMDAIIGGVVFLNIIITAPIQNLFVLLIISNIIYGAYYYYIAVVLKPDFKIWYIMLSTIVTINFVNILYILYQPSNQQTHLFFYFSLIFFFTFSSNSLLAFATTLLSESIVEYKRGSVVGIWIGIALAIAGISELKIVKDVASRDNLIVLTIFGFLTFLLIASLFLHYWTKTHRTEINRLETKIPRKAVSMRDRWVLYAITTTSMFLFASGMIYSILLRIEKFYTTEYRGYGFLIAAPILFVCSKMSDKIGRHSILFLASTATLFSVIAGNIFRQTLISVILEITGYYMIISFFMLQITDLYPQKLIEYSGTLWAILYAIDLGGALIADIFISFINIEGVFIIASFILIISIMVSSLIPNFVLKETTVKSLLLINEDGMILYKIGEIEPTKNGEEPVEEELYGALLFAIKNFADQLTKKSTLNRIQFDKDKLAILGKRKPLVAVIFVDHYSERIEEKFEEFIKKTTPIVVKANAKSRFSLEEEFKQKIEELIQLFFPEFRGKTTA